jgi:hypothetical protein
MKISEFDLMKNDLPTIDVLKILGKVWTNRTDNEIVTDLANLLCQFVDEKHVFEDLEFYVPQIAHLAIHVNHHKRNEALEMLLALIAETSTQTAFKLSLYFSSCLQDYQSELPSGEINPSSNSFLFCKCARLLEDVERAVIYGSQIISPDEKIEIERTHAFSRSNNDLATLVSANSTPPVDNNCCMATATASGSNSSASNNSPTEPISNNNNGSPPLKTLKELKKVEVARRISRSDSFQFHVPQLSGDLYFKRNQRKSIFYSKIWKIRYFVIDKKILLCFRDPFSVTPLRSLDLRYASVKDLETHPKYGNTVFEIVDEATGTVFHLRAESEEKKQNWMEVLLRYENDYLLCDMFLHTFLCLIFLVKLMEHVQ